MANARLSIHLHGDSLKPSIKYLETPTSHSNLFVLSYQGSNITFFINDDDDFRIFMEKLSSLSQTYLSEKETSVS